MNFKEEAAIYSVNTPMMVEASAGSGKTTLLVDKYISILIYLTAFLNKSPFEAVREIVAITFTRKAAEEIKDRIRKMISEKFTVSFLKNSIEKIEDSGDAERIDSESGALKIVSQKDILLGALSTASVSTIHSFALDILKTHPVETLLDPAASPDGDMTDSEAFITGRDALYSTLRKLIDRNDPFLAGLIKIIGYEKTLSLLEELMKSVDSYGINSLREMAAAGGYLDYKGVIKDTDWLSGKVMPHFKSLLFSLEEARPDVGKTGLAGLDRVIGKIKSAMMIENVPDLFHADFYYDGTSGTIKDASCNAYESISTEMHKYVFQNLWIVFEFVFASYKDLKKERREISFSDIETILLDSIKKDREFTDEIKKNTHYILIDEYQDTSNIQKSIFDALIYDGSGGLAMIPFIVGDPKQSIYGFRNANVEIFGKTRLELLRFQSSYEEPVFLELDRNFRSGEKLVDDFNEIFSEVFKNEETGYRNQTSGSLSSSGTREGVYFVPSEGTRSDEIMSSSCRNAAYLISELVSSGGYRPREIMVLIRKKTKIPILREVFEDILGKRGIPYYHVDSSNILDTREIQDIIIYLQALENPFSNYYFLPLLKSPFFRKTDPEIISFMMENENLFDSLNKDYNSDEMELFNDIRFKKNRVSIADLAEEIINRSGYFSFLSSLPYRKEATTNVIVFLDYLRKLQSMEMFNLTDFLYYIQEYGVSLSKPRVIGEKSDVVRVMTVHASKGLEARAVIYITSSSGASEHRSIIFSKGGGKGSMGIRIIKPDINYSGITDSVRKSEAEEEKRLAYVTFTRARELFYYIGTDGNDGWKAFINLGKSFALKRKASIDCKTPVSESRGVDTLAAMRAAKQYGILKKNSSVRDYVSFPRVITVTQLLDMEYLESAFRKRYIEKSFPVEEALGEIASSEEIRNAGPAADEGIFLHRVFQTASADDYTDFIDRALLQEGGELKSRRESLIGSARAFYESSFYGKYNNSQFKQNKEWEINYTFRFEEKPVLIKAVVDLYIERGSDGGTVVDYKLNYNTSSGRYDRQVNYYAYFLNELGYPADELFIFDINEGREFPVKKNTSDIHEIIQKNLTSMKKIYSALTPGR